MERQPLGFAILRPFPPDGEIREGAVPYRGKRGSTAAEGWRTPVSEAHRALREASDFPAGSPDSFRPPVRRKADRLEGTAAPRGTGNRALWATPNRWISPLFPFLPAVSAEPRPGGSFCYLSYEELKAAGEGMFELDPSHIKPNRHPPPPPVPEENE